MKAISLIAVLFFLFNLASANAVFAASQLSIDNFPLTIDQQQEFEIGINFSCPGCSDSYLRGVFYPSGNGYFGYTQDNSGNWSNTPGGNCITYFKIAKIDLTSEGSWSGKLKFKPDINSSYYSGPGEYLFKVGRYTPSCGSPSVWSQEATIAITGPTPTPTPTSTPIPTPTPTSTPTNTPSPTKTPTPVPIHTPTPSLKPSASSIPSEILPTSVLGESTESGEIVSSTDALFSNENMLISSKPKNTNSNLFQKIFIWIGSIFLISCAILSFRVYIKNKKQNSETL